VSLMVRREAAVPIQRATALTDSPTAHTLNRHGRIRRQGRDPIASRPTRNARWDRAAVADATAPRRVEAEPVNLAEVRSTDRQVAAVELAPVEGAVTDVKYSA
jgi:hypothetical protein